MADESVILLSQQWQTPSIVIVYETEGLKGTFPIVIAIYTRFFATTHTHMDLYAIILHVGPLNHPQTALTFICAV